MAEDGNGSRTLSAEQQQKMQEARRRSGKLGGRPRRPTSDEAREGALARLVPKAIQKLEEHLDCGDPRVEAQAAIKLIEYEYGKPRQQLDVRDERPTQITWTQEPWLFGLPENGESN